MRFRNPLSGARGNFKIEGETRASVLNSKRAHWLEMRSWPLNANVKVCNYLISFHSPIFSILSLLWTEEFQTMKILKIHTHTLICDPGFSQRANAAFGSLELVTLFNWIDGDGCNYLQWDCVSCDDVSCTSASLTCGTHTEGSFSDCGAS